MSPNLRTSLLMSSLLLGFTLTNVACSGSVPVAHEPPPQRLPAATAFGSSIFRVGKPVVFADGLRVELKGIADSRCPAKVQCIWQGELTANLIARGGDLGNGESVVALGMVSAKHRALEPYDFVLADISTGTATVIVTKPGAAVH